MYKFVRLPTWLIHTLGLISMILVFGSLQAETSDKIHFQIAQQGSVLAQSGPAIVTQGDFDAYMTRIPESDHVAFLNSPSRVEQALTQLVVVRHYMAEAERTGLLEEALHQALMFQTAAVLTADRMTERFVEENTLEDYTDRALEMFLSNPTRFRKSNRLDFTHLLIRVSPEDDQVEAMEKMLELHARLRDGANLDELVLEYSDDPQLENNQGRYRGVDSEELEGTIRRHIELLEPGERSQPFPSGLGWHIVRLDARHDGEVPQSFDEIREHAIDVARREHQSRLQERLRSRLTGDHEFVIPEGAIRELLDRYGASWSRDHEELISEDE